MNADDFNAREWTSYRTTCDAAELLEENPGSRGQKHMARRKTHARIGFLCGLVAAAALLYARFERLLFLPFFRGAHQTDFVMLLLLGPGTAWLGSHVPDLLEPSIKGPSHRQFFHSAFCILLLLVLLAALATGHLFDGATREGFYLRILVSFTILGYLSHVGADVFSPGGIPWY